MSETIAIGLRHTMSLTVGPHLTVPQVSHEFDFADMPAVFATAYMVAFLEATCLNAVKPFLGKDQRTVGTHVDVSHLAATPIGMTVTAEAELVAVEGRKLRFKIRCSDDSDLIAEGFHERFIIDVPRFSERLAKKLLAAGL